MSFIEGYRQSFSLPKPELTEQNCPDQTGRVHIVTGGYGGCGFELAKILYQHNATLYIAGRSEDKASKAIANLKEKFPNAKGSVETVIVDFSDFTSIKPAADKFVASQKSLHVLTLNHGVMFPPKGSKGAQGFDLQLATNVIGSYLFYALLQPTLAATAATAAPGVVRVTWASSLGMELGSPKPGGIKFNADGAPSQQLDSQTQYSQTKAANTILAAVLARRDRAAGIMHLSWNPGNLHTDLARSLPQFLVKTFGPLLVYPAVYGGYTELFAAVAPIDFEKSGSFIAPWGRLRHIRKDIQAGIDDTSAESVGERLLKWAEATTKPYA